MIQLSSLPSIYLSPKDVKAKVLIVDDEPGWRDLLSYELSPREFEISIAGNPSEALFLLNQRSFDLIITDVRMPGPMDGIDLVETYRLQNPLQKVIFITGYATDEKLAEATQSKHSACLKKPFNIEMLFDEIEKLIQK